MKLIRTRTSQRVLVGLGALISLAVGLAEADVRFVSGILAPVIARNAWLYGTIGKSRLLSRPPLGGHCANPRYPPEGGRYEFPHRTFVWIIPEFARAPPCVLRPNRSLPRRADPQQATRYRWGDFLRPIGQPPDTPA